MRDEFEYSFIIQLFRFIKESNEIERKKELVCEVLMKRDFTWTDEDEKKRYE